MTTSDESALIALSMRYADAVRAQDPVTWGATWTEDARWVIGPGRDVVGREAIVELWHRSIAKYTRVVQLYQAAAYEIGIDGDPDVAAGRCTLIELNEVGDGTRKVLAGHYDDTYRRTPDGWRFTSRELTRYYAGPPDLLGEWFDAP